MTDDLEPIGPPLKAVPESERGHAFAPARFVEIAGDQPVFERVIPTYDFVDATSTTPIAARG